MIGSAGTDARGIAAGQLNPTVDSIADVVFGNYEGDLYGLFPNMTDSDEDGMVELFEFLFGTDPGNPNSWPRKLDANGMSVILRDLSPQSGIQVTFESCTDLKSWVPRSDLVSVHPDQSGVVSGLAEQNRITLL